MSQLTFNFDAVKPIVPSVAKDTSELMAEIIESDSKTVRHEKELLRQFIADPDGLTDEEIRLMFDWTSDYERPRRWSLEKQGFVYDTGTKRKNSKGNLMTIWRHVKYRDGNYLKPREIA
jgi:hypothetical protein